MPDFTEEQIERYSRHILLTEVGVEGQQRLLASSAFVVGAGGLGSPAIMYLAAAGVGRIGVVDSDVVELSNLQRQIVHGTSDLGRRKALAAEETIEEINPDCDVEVFDQRLKVANVRDAMRGYDVVLDGSDNFPTRFLVADLCWFESVPLVSAAVLRFEGQLMTVLPGEGNPCYRCFVAEPPPPGMVPSCQEAGVLGAVVGVMGTLQAVEAIKILLGIGADLSRDLLLYDALDGRFTRVKRARDPACPLCGEEPAITDLVEYDALCEAPASSGGGSQ
ncbi:MAG: ThiF family adenylyltransferase [Armatimonadota bacterium]